MNLKNTAKTLSGYFLAASMIGTNVLAQPADDVTQDFEHTQLTDIFCKQAEKITTDNHGNHWVSVDAMTKDAIPIKFDLSVKYDLSDNEDTLKSSICLALKNHVLGLARVIYAENIFEHSYAELGQQASLILQETSAELQQTINQLLGISGLVEITSMGLKNISAPGFQDQHQAFKMLTQGIELLESPTKSNKKLSVEIDAGSSINISMDAQFHITEETYRLYGPNDYLISNKVFQTIANNLARVIQEQYETNGLIDFDLARNDAYLLSSVQVSDESKAILLGLDLEIEREGQACKNVAKLSYANCLP